MVLDWENHKAIFVFLEDRFYCCHFFLFKVLDSNDLISIHEINEVIIKTIINDSDIKQNYPVSDMMFSTDEIVMYLSQNMTLYAGDVICVGTSLGLGPMEKGSKVTIDIESIGSLTNTYG